MNEISSMGLPVIVEAVETEERIAAVLPEIDPIIRGGVLTLERASSCRALRVREALRGALTRRGASPGASRER